MLTKQNTIFLIGLVFWALFTINAIWEFEFLWAIHFIHFLPPIAKASIVVFCLLVLIFFRAFDKKILEWHTEFLHFDKAKVPILLASTLIFFYFNIYENVYGDSVQFIERLGYSTTNYSPKYLTHLFSLNITNPKLGNLTVLSFVRLISYVFSISHHTVFRLLGVASGLLFVGIGLYYIRLFIKNNALKWLLLLATIFSPFSQLFLGHYEIYAPAFPAALWFFIQLKVYLTSKKNKNLLLAIFACIICIKLHFTFILLLPSLLIIIGIKLNVKDLTNKLNWKSIGKFVLLPFVLLGTVAYFFIFQDYKDERFLSSSVNLYDRLFLPIVSPEAPLDNYNLFSFNHILDFTNMTFLWSTVGIFLLLVLFVFYRKSINWNKPEIILTGLSGILFTLVFFAFNPLLGMPIDFDLFSIAAPNFLIFTFFCVEQVKPKEFVRFTQGGVIAISVFSITIFLCNHQQNSLSQRMVSTGKHIFKTYWIRSAGDIQLGLNLVKDNSAAYLQNYLKVSEELKSFATPGNDIEFANIQMAIGKHYRLINKDYKAALQFHESAKNYAPNFSANYIGLMECNYFLKDYSEAFKHSTKLLQYNYPTKKRALEIAIECAKKAGYEREVNQLTYQLKSLST